MFERFRAALRLSATGPSPLREAYALAAPEARAVRRDLETLREELQKLSAQEDLPPQDRKLGRIVLTHLDRYWTSLGLPEGSRDGGGLPLRTTNFLARAARGTVRKDQTSRQARLTCKTVVRNDTPEERVNRRPWVDESGSAGMFENRPWFPPLPRGEGRGKGEWAAQQHRFPKAQLRPPKSMQKT